MIKNAVHIIHVKKHCKTKLKIESCPNKNINIFYRDLAPDFF